MLLQSLCVFSHLNTWCTLPPPTATITDVFLLQFVEPFRSDKWSPNDVRLFLTQYTVCAHTLDAFRFVASPRPRWPTVLVLLCLPCPASPVSKPVGLRKGRRGPVACRVEVLVASCCLCAVTYLFFFRRKAHGGRGGYFHLEKRKDFSPVSEA